MLPLRDAIQLLKQKRALLNQTLKEIEELKQVIIAHGANPGKSDLTERNANIYRDFTNSTSFTQLAEKYQVSSGHVRTICRRAQKKEKIRG